MDQPPSPTFLRPPPLLVANAIFVIIVGVLLTAYSVPELIYGPGGMGACIVIPFVCLLAVSQYWAVFRRSQDAVGMTMAVYALLATIGVFALVMNIGETIASRTRFRSDHIWLLLIMAAVTAYAIGAAILNARWSKRLQSPPAGLCRQCGYDLRAHTPGQLCPECGTVVPVDVA